VSPEVKEGRFSCLAEIRLYSVAPYNDLTGAPISSLKHAESLRSQFGSVCLVLPKAGGLVDRAAALAVPVLVLPVENRGLRSHLFRWSIFQDIAAILGSRWRYYRGLCRELRRVPGLVHVQSRASIAPLALLAARRCHCPSVLHIREIAMPSKRDCLWAWLLSKCASAVVCVSDGIRQGYGEGIRRKARVIHNCMPLPSPRDPPQYPVPRILIAARMGYPKGYDVFLEACRILRDEGVGFTAEMVGGWHSSEQHQEALAYVREHQLESMIEDCGVVGDMAPVYARADILTLPTRWDSFPRVVMEAMCYGIPVVASRVDGVPEMVDDGVTGFLVPSEDAAGFATALRRLIEDKALRLQMGEAGRKRAARLFAPDTYIQACSDLYEEIMPPGGLRKG